MPGKNDFANYRKMSEPFENSEKANKALEDFFKAVEAARKEFHIMDVHVVVMMNILRDEAEGTAFAAAHYGDTLKGSSMCAWGLGQEQSALESVLEKYTKTGRND